MHNLYSMSRPEGPIKNKSLAYICFHSHRPRLVVQVSDCRCMSRMQRGRCYGMGRWRSLRLKEYAPVPSTACSATRWSTSLPRTIKETQTQPQRPHRTLVSRCVETEYAWIEILRHTSRNTTLHPEYSCPPQEHNRDQPLHGGVRPQEH